jgi:hypothetical protein
MSTFLDAELEFANDKLYKFARASRLNMLEAAKREVS